MEKIDYTKKCEEIMKQCKLTLDDLIFIANTTKAKNSEEMFYELEEMLRNNQIRIGG